MSRPVLRLPLVLVGSVLILLVVAGPASAHSVLISTTPGSGSTVARTPAVVVLTFNEPAVALGTEVLISNADGPVEQGAPSLVDNTVSQALKPGSPAGEYEVDWRVTSTDGHPVTGKFTFTSRAAGVAGRSATDASTPGLPGAGRSTAWVWAAVGVLVVLTVTTVLRRIVRRRPTDASGPTVPDPETQPVSHDPTPGDRDE